MGMLLMLMVFMPRLALRLTPARARAGMIVHLSVGTTRVVETVVVIVVMYPRVSRELIGA